MIARVLLVLVLAVLPACDQLGGFDAAEDGATTEAPELLGGYVLDDPEVPAEGDRRDVAGEDSGEAPDDGLAADDEPEAAPGPERETAGAEVAAPPEPDANAEARAACLRKGGNFVKAGPSGARACTFRTRDANKQCTNGRQCEGVCLARSRTCSPVKPLFGCNEVFTDNGRRATICID